MKYNLLYFSFWSLLFLCSCKDDKDFISPTPVEDSRIEVTFRLEGEILESSDFSENATNESPDLYGIEVVYADETAYAYGLFDDIRLAKILLQENRKYTFRVMAVPNGKELCFSDFRGYREIFSRDVEFMFGAGEGCPLTNEFIYHPKVNFCTFDNPTLSYYYEVYAGYVPDYSPNENSTLNVNMDRMFGKIKLVSEDLNMGKLSFQYLSNNNVPPANIPNVGIRKFMLTPESPHAEFVYTLRRWGDENRWMPKDFSFTNEYIVRWTDDSGHTTELGIHTMTIQRNEETKVVLNLAELLNE